MELVRTAPASLQQLAFSGAGARDPVTLQTLGAAMSHLTALTGALFPVQPYYLL